ncbi:polyprenol monophosphomannose synthase [Candidatus Azambacteria bacterium]|nr:polyprenol monophosphomannose synthase [Candidatus Azambacteria bacterium]
MIVAVIPTYNERSNIARLLGRRFRALPDIHVLFVDDNSPDGTGEEILNLRHTYPGITLLSRPKKQGLGSAYREGLTLALENVSWRAIVMMDADLSHEPEALPAMLRELARADVVIGSRYVRGGNVKNWSWLRQALSRFGNWYARMILRESIRDLTAGFYAIRREALDAITIPGIRSEGYAFQIELKLAFFRKNLNIKEVPITFFERTAGASKLGFSTIWEALVLPWKLRLAKSLLRS